MGKSCKVVVCGQASVGKTSILEQLLYGNHVVGSEMIETQEDIYVGSIETDRGVREQVRFYDTRGLRDGAELPRHCFSCTDGYVLVYSTDSRESFQRVELLKKEIDKSKDKKEVTIVVLGNKCDLQEQRRVDPDVAQHWAKSEKVKLWEVSVADRRSLLEPFVYLASKMTQPQSKSAFPSAARTRAAAPWTAEELPPTPSRPHPAPGTRSGGGVGSKPALPVSRGRSALGQAAASLPPGCRRGSGRCTSLG